MQVLTTQQQLPARQQVPFGQCQHTPSRAVPARHQAQNAARPVNQAQRRHRSAASAAAATTPAAATADIQTWVQQSREARLAHLKDQALTALRAAVDTFERPVFPCALIAGDVVLLHLLHELGYLADKRVTVVFIDTFHLFPETHTFLHQLEAKYGFKAVTYQAAGLADVKEYRAKHGSDLYITDMEAYDRICKVEPFNRALKEQGADVMINGRRRDHGFERAFLEVFEEGQPVKCNALAYWEFKDCWDYLHANKLEHHPLHDQGFPSIGDVQTTVPVPQDQWFEYAGERKGRFQGLDRTECGIHQPVPGLQIERKRKKALPLSRPILTRLVVLGMLGIFFWQWWPYLQSSGGQSQLPFLSSSARHKSASAASGGLVGALRSLTFSVPASSQWPPLMHEWALETYLIRRGQVYRLFLSSLVHVNLLHLLANCLALHEFGKDLERHVGSVNMAAILVASAVGSGLAATHFGLGASAVPLGASGLVTGVLGAVIMLSLLWKELRDQDLVGTSAVGVAAAILLGHLVSLLDNRIHAGGLFSGALCALLVHLQSILLKVVGVRRRGS